ncbi:MAG: YdcF family protein [Cyanobacteria bacterium P01_H01_bin.130]
MEPTSHPPRRIPQRHRSRRWLLTAMATTIGALSLKLMGIQPSATHPLPHPDAIFVLGGSIAREREAAKLAVQHPQMPVWVSSGTPAEYVRHHVFHPANIDDRRLHLDYRAVDTVTNFTTLVDDFQRHNIRSLYLITSDDHMPRAKAIANVVLGSRGIKIHPIAVPSGRAPEPWEKVWRDRLRSILWLCTGWTGDNLRKPKA